MDTLLILVRELAIFSGACLFCFIFFDLYQIIKDLVKLWNDKEHM